jgi:DNA excision repair protein ERCC-2
MSQSLTPSISDAKPTEPDPDRAEGSVGEPSPGLRISVRGLCEFTARRGDLDRRAHASPHARQGIAAHRLVAQRRSPEHEVELPLQFLHGPLRVVGRADIFDPVAGELEEVKSGFGSPGRRSQAARALHRAQLRSYGAMLCAARGLETIRLTLVHFDLLNDTEHRDSEDCSAAELLAELRSRCEAFSDWAHSEIEHRALRDEALRRLEWPFDGFRAGQRELAAAVWRACRDGRMLRAQAPTGIGKTLGTIFPALRAMPDAGTDRLIFLSARGTGRQTTVAALRPLARRFARPTPLRMLELVARERACEHPDRECHGESCPLARGFFDRLPAARIEAARQALLDQARLREIALDHQICPYYLGSEMAAWSDLIVADYNHWFDRHALLYALALERQWSVSLLVDEAHHLVERTRAMYSPSLSLAAFIAVRRDGSSGLAASAIDPVIDQWDLLLAEAGVGTERPWVRLERLPGRWLRALHRFNRAVARCLEEGTPALGPAALALYFRSLEFATLAEAFDEHSLCELSLDSVSPESESTELRIGLRNVVPASFVRERIAEARSLAMFSATLNPEDFDQAMLGWQREHRTVLLESPFDPDHLQVRTVPLSTRLDRRAHSAAPIAALIAREFAAEPGCYIAFFSSFDYLEQVAEALRGRDPDLPLRLQTRQMHERERERFMAGFDPERPSVALAVLGGVFAEGMDLPGRRLIGAFIVTMGMPQATPLTEAIAERLEHLFGRGFDYTYLYPGLRKVIQAAGRVIRDVEDRGRVFLIDDRWQRPRYRALLPAAWRLGP